MTERLYILNYEIKTEVDLPNPSGITLRYNSPLFDNIEKISNSYSYSFALPKTRRNMMIFGLADDVRTANMMFTRKIRCSYEIDGLAMVRGAYLYMSEVEKEYICCMVWGVIDGLVHIQEHDTSIRNLDEYTDYTRMDRRTTFTGEGARTLVDYGVMSDVTGSYPTVITPYYGMGVPYGRATDRNPNITIPSRVAEYDSETLEVKNYAKIFPNPAIRIDALMQRINEYFHTDIRLTRNGGTDEMSIDMGDVFSHGIIPMVKNETSRRLNEAMSQTFSDVAKGQIHDAQKGDKEDGWMAVTFRSATEPTFADNGMMELYWSAFSNCHHMMFKPKNYLMYGVHPRLGASIAFDGKITLQYTREEYDRVKKDGPKVCVWRMIRKYRWDKELGEPTYHLEKDGDDYEVASVDGVFDFENSVYRGSPNYREHDEEKFVFHVDFSQGDGFDRMDCGVCGKGSGHTIEIPPSQYPGGLRYERDYYVYVLVVNGNVLLEDTHVKVVPRFDNGVVYDHYDRGVDCSHKTDLYPNLPDISCLEFVKSLFYIGGGFPVVEDDGRITIRRYSDIRRNRDSGNVYDWSDRLAVGEPKIAYTMKDFAKKNFYRMKHETEDDEGETYNDDVYSSEKCVIEIHNDMLDESKTVITLPFYGRYTRQGTNHNVVTGDGMKLWKYENGVYEACEGNPSLMTLEMQNGDYKEMYMGARVWTFEEQPSMDYARRILMYGRTLSVDIRVRLLDMMQFDYTKPVYIERFNSYFAIQSIEWTVKNGTFKLNAIKLPE